MLRNSFKLEENPRTYIIFDHLITFFLFFYINDRKTEQIPQHQFNILSRVSKALSFIRKS